MARLERPRSPSETRRSWPRWPWCWNECRFDVVHFNNGLHGWGYNEEEYQKHFPELVATIRKHAPKAKLTWATTTPVRTSGDLTVFDDAPSGCKHETRSPR